MLKFFLAILCAIVITIFAMDNMDRVDFGLVAGRPVQVRLFFLLLTSFLLGCITTMLMGLYVRAKGNNKHKTIGKGKVEEEDDFFSA